MTLKEARTLIGVTQRQLDELAGVRSGTVADIELGRNTRPSHETVVRIVRALHRKGLTGVTDDDLFPIAEDAPAVQVAAVATAPSQPREPLDDRRRSDADRRKGLRRRANREADPERRGEMLGDRRKAPRAEGSQ